MPAVEAGGVAEKMLMLRVVCDCYVYLVTPNLGGAIQLPLVTATVSILSQSTGVKKWRRLASFTAISLGSFVATKFQFGVIAASRLSRQTAIDTNW